MGLKFDMGPLLAKIDELDKKVKKDVIDKALRETAESIILPAQLYSVPVDSGELAHSLKVVKITGSGTKRKILVGIDPKKYDEVKYGFYQEYGTDVMMGKKWMKLAWLASVKKAQEKMAESIAEDLKKL